MSQEHEKGYFVGFSKMHVYFFSCIDQNNMEFITIPSVKMQCNINSDKKGKQETSDSEITEEAWIHILFFFFNRCENSSRAA